MRQLVLTAALLVLCSLILVAQQDSTPTVPRFVRFAATLTGAPATTGTRGFTFALYKDQTGGAPLWQEVQNVVVDASGHYSLLLGSNSKDGVPVELFTTNEARWLGVQVEQEAEEPRVLLVSVPYALKASDAETLGGQPLSAFVMAQPQSTTTSSSAPSTTASTSTATKSTARLGVAPNTVVNPTPTATGTTNFVAKFDAASNLITSSLFDNGNIGIGTPGPGAKLEVDGSGAGNPTLILKDTTAQQQLTFLANAPLAYANPLVQPGDQLLVYQGNGVDTGSLVIGPWSNSSKGIRIGSNGNVGIGTTAPGQMLSVNGVIESLGGFKFPDGSVQLTGAETGTAARTRGITFLAGCDTCAVLADTDDQKTIYANVVGAMTFQSVTCYSDTGAPVINIQRNTGSAANILAPDLTCSTTGVTSTSFVAGQNVLNVNDVLDFSMVTAGGAAHRVTVVIRTQLN